MNPTDARFAALERSVQRQRLLIAGLGGVLALLLFAGSTPQPSGPSDLLRAKRFEVVNDAGGPVVVLASGPAGGILAVQSPSGQTLVTLSSTREGAGLVAVAGPKGERLVELSGRAADGIATVNTFNSQGDVAVSISSSKGGGVVQAFNSQKLPAAMLGSASDEGVIAVFDAAGKVRQTMPSDKKDSKTHP